MSAATGTPAAFDVIGLGETMMSFIATDGPLHAATSFHATHGGAETNTLIGLSRLGLTTAWVSRLGDDAFGGRIRRALEGEGVDLRWVRVDPVRPTGVMIRDGAGTVTYRRSGSAAAGLSPRDLDEVSLSEARAVIVTGVTALIGADPQRTAAAFLDRADGLRVVDPNLRPGLWGSDRAAALIAPLIERCDLLLGGAGELAAIVGEPTAALDPQALAQRLRAMGPAEIVLKRGAAGAGVLDGEGSWIEHAEPVARELDPVGAGDAFNAAYLHARLGGLGPSEALVAGARAGAVAAGSFGDTGSPIASATSGQDR